MTRTILVNKRTQPGDERVFIATAYDYGGHTRILPPNSRTEVSDSEAQLCLSRFQCAGVSVEYEKDGPVAG